MLKNFLKSSYIVMNEKGVNLVPLYLNRREVKSEAEAYSLVSRIAEPVEIVEVTGRQLLNVG